MRTTETKNEPGLVIIYARRSSEGEDSSLSLGAQVGHCRQLVERNGQKVLAELTEVASGGTDQRPRFQEAIKLATDKKNKVVAFVVYDLSRFTRNPEDFFDYYGLLKRSGVQLQSVLEPHRGDEMSDLFYSIITIFNSVLLPRIARLTRRGQFEATKEGYFVGPKAPYGYKKYYVQVGKKERAKLERDDDTWDIARWIWDLMLDNHTAGDTAEKLNDAGIRTSQGNEWTGDAVLDIVRNEAYKGHLVRGKGSKSKYLDRTETARYENAHEAMVTPDEFKKVQELVEARAPEQGSPRSHSSPNLFTNKVFCGKCNRLEKPVRMTVRRDSGGRPSLVCSRKRALRVKACNNENVNLNLLHETVLDHLLGHVLTDDFLEEQVSLVAQKYRESVAEDNRKVATLKRRMTRNRKESNNLILTLKENGPNQDVSDSVNGLREEYDNLENQLRVHQENMKTRAAFVNTPEVVIANAMDKRTYLESKDPHKVKQLVNLFINEISIVDRVATIEYQIPVPDEYGNPILSETIHVDNKRGLLEGCKTTAPPPPVHGRSSSALPWPGRCRSPPCSPSLDTSSRRPVAAVSGRDCWASAPR